MNKVLAATLAVMPLFLVATPAAQAAQVTIAANGPVVELAVSASVNAEPDVVTLAAGVSSRAMTTAAAAKANADKMNRLVAAVRKLGVADADIQTSAFNVAPQWNYVANGAPTFAGYEVSNTVTFKLRKLALAGPALDALIAAGANQISGPTFAIDDPAPLRDQARKKAFAEATARANAYAAMAGYPKVRLLEVSEAFSARPVAYEMAPVAVSAMAKDASTPIVPGEVETGVTLTVKFEMVR